MGLNLKSKQDLEDFKSYILVEKNFSEHTAKAYYADILAYLIWLDETGCEEVNLTKVREYLHHIQVHNYKKTTLARKIASLRTFYKYLHREKKVETNPAMDLISPKRPRPLPKFITMEEIEQICTRIAIMDKGRKIAEGTKDQLKRMIKNTETITTELLELPDNVLSQISALPHVYSADYSGDKLTVCCSGGKHNLIRVLDVLQKNDLSFGRVYTELPTLNDVFLEITGTALRDK